MHLAHQSISLLISSLRSHSRTAPALASICSPVAHRLAAPSCHRASSPPISLTHHLTPSPLHSLACLPVLPASIELAPPSAHHPFISLTCPSVTSAPLHTARRRSFHPALHVLLAPSQRSPPPPRERPVARASVASRHDLTRQPLHGSFFRSPTHRGRLLTSRPSRRRRLRPGGAVLNYVVLGLTWPLAGPRDRPLIEELKEPSVCFHAVTTIDQACRTFSATLAA
jgi:hypothetical protein